MKFEIKLPQLTCHDDCCQKIQVSMSINPQISDGAGIQIYDRCGFRLFQKELRVKE